LEKDPDAYRRQQRRTKYGMEQEDYDELLESQGGRCAICGRPFGRVCIDHDHATGQVRGLLCNLCNSRLGWFEFYGVAVLDYLEI
jgi:Recombination endonuclease VII